MAVGSSKNFDLNSGNLVKGKHVIGEDKCPVFFRLVFIMLKWQWIERLNKKICSGTNKSCCQSVEPLIYRWLNWYDSRG